MSNSYSRESKDADSVLTIQQNSPFDVKSVLTEDGSTWVFYDANPPGTSAEAHVTLSDTTGLTVVADFHGFWKGNSTVNGTTYDTIVMPQLGSTVNDGKPTLPRLTKYLEIPHGVNLTFDVTYSESQIIGGYNILPFQTLSMSLPNMSAPPFTKDSTLYSTNAFYPDIQVTIDGEMSASPIILRGRRLLEFNIYPVQFNPITGNLTVFSKIQARFNYNNPAQIEQVNASLWSEPFENIFESFILNYKDWGSSDGTSIGNSIPEYLTSSDYVTADYPTDGAEYLIITDNLFIEQADELAAWKTRKGLFTQVWTIDDICVDGGILDRIEITDFIEDAYFTWNPAPTYIVLLGDSDFIPCHYDLLHTATWTDDDGDTFPVHGIDDTGLIASDLPYFTTEGIDYFPEIIYGRISVETEDEAIIAVNKIISYEKEPPIDIASEEFYDSIMGSTDFYDSADTDKTEDEPFASVSEELREYLKDLYLVQTCYSSDGLDVDSELHDGSSVDTSIDWDADTSDVISHFNAGRFLVYHIDHGTSRNFYWYNHEDPYGIFRNVHFDGWLYPRFTTEHVDGTDTSHGTLSNGPWLPFVLSMECHNGWFDGEIDEDFENTNFDSLGYNEEECLSEILTRFDDGGAIAVVASTRGSWNDPAGDLAKGIISGIWPGLLTQYQNRPIFDMGSALLFGKLCVEEKWHDDTSLENIERKYSEITSHEYHLFGDPETPIWTAKPSELVVSYPSSIGTADAQEFVIKVNHKISGEPVHHAKVCLQKDQEVYEVGYTNILGHVLFSVEPLTAGEMHLTVTKQNFKPNVSEILVVLSDATIGLVPNHSEANLNVQITLANFDDEIVDVYFETTLVVPEITTVGGSFSDQRPIPLSDLGPVYVRAVGRDSGKVAVVLFTLLSDELGPDPYTYCQWDATTWHLAAPNPENLYWNNPCIQLYKEDGTEVQSNNLEVLQRYKIRAYIYNSIEQITADNTVVTFTWSHFGAGQRTRNLIGTDTIQVTHDVEAYAEVYWTPTKTGHTCIRASIFHPRDENSLNNVGQENTNVQPIQSPGFIGFSVQNPTCRDNYYYLEVRQLGNLSEENTIWESTINEIAPYPLLMGYNTTITLEINAPADAQLNESRTFIVNVYFGDLLVGGISTLVVKRDISIPYVDPLLIIAIIGGVVVVVGIILRTKSDAMRKVGRRILRRS